MWGGWVEHHHTEKSRRLQGVIDINVDTTGWIVPPLLSPVSSSLSMDTPLTNKSNYMEEKGGGEKE